MKVTTHQVGEHDALLTAYVQDRSEELRDVHRRPGVLVLPGGGYLMTSDREAEPVELAYLAAGFNAFVLRYAVGQDVPVERSGADGRAALRWLREHAEDVALAPGQLAVAGFSAGGHLAISLGTGPEGRPDALVLGYPVVLEELGARLGKQIGDVLADVDPRTPPTFVFSTVPDEVVPVRHTLGLLSVLDRHGVPFEAHLYPHGAHGLSLAQRHTAGGRPEMVEPVVAGWLEDSVRFLRRTFGVD